MNAPLPEGWEWSTIGEVAHVQLGRQRSPEHHDGDQMRPYLRSANVTWDGISVEDVKEMNFDDADFEKYRLQPGDLLLNEASGSPGEVGKPAIWAGELEGCCFQNTLLRLRARGIHRSYLYWYCHFAAFTGRFGDAGRGVNIRHLGKRGLSGFPIPVPSVREQRRIVDLLEEHLSRLDAAGRGIEAAGRRLAQFEDAVLAKVFIESWPRVPLDALNDPDRPICYGILKPKTDEPGVVPYVEVRSIKGRRIMVDSLHRTTLDLHREFSRSELAEGDVVMAIRGSFDRAAVVPASLHGANVSRDVARIAPRGALLPAFLAGFLGSPEAQAYFRAHARGVAVRGVNIGDLRRLPVPAPSVAEQETASRRLLQLLQQERRIAEEIEHAEHRSRLMKSALLSAAFAGRLASNSRIGCEDGVLARRG